MLPSNLGELRSSEFGSDSYRTRTIKDEMRTNLIRKLQAKEPIFTGIVGYEDTVVPQVVNAILSKHNMILLGLRGQAKSRILRDMVSFLDDVIPVIAGCEIHDSPFSPICRRCRELIAKCGDATALAWLAPEQRYVEKLATPDVTIADIIGDLDPIRAARSGLDLSDELTIHYGLLPRAHRGIFAINELPDLAGKIQVGLFNILQEGDVQIKGYPIRLPLDVLMVFTANPEDYTARGKIVTPLKDRLGSEIRTHYPDTLEQAVSITREEAWTARGEEGKVLVPYYIREVVEEVAIQARKDRRVDQRSGVSQRLPITLLENVVSNAERRAILHKEEFVVPRVSDVYASLHAITGKLELDYEGELKGADVVARDLVRRAVSQTFQKYLGGEDLNRVVEWFETGGYLKLPDVTPAGEAFGSLEKIEGLIEKTRLLGVSKKDPTAVVVAAAEFILDGMAGMKRISRSEERRFSRAERSHPEIGIEPVDTAKRHLN